MGCTVSFICCEEDFLQMPAYQHEVEEKKKESLKEVRSARRNALDQAGRACLFAFHSPVDFMWNIKIRYFDLWFHLIHFKAYL